MGPAVRFSFVACRWWAAAYTWGMAAEARQSRVDEITSDLWESAHDCSSQNDCDLRCAAQMLLRTAIGAPSDLLWRCEHA
ncbi:MAG TPA: hypothetical protein VJP86_11640, partial [Vicinamibacterales bacterium]|nr:hypothetical protein [Vicinamibacterales bacterium]